jgi:hypothetical protein
MRRQRAGRLTNPRLFWAKFGHAPCQERLIGSEAITVSRLIIHNVEYLQNSPQVIKSLNVSLLFIKILFQDILI